MGGALKWTGIVIVTLVLIGLMTAAICGVAFSIYIDKYINPTIDINLDSLRLNYTSFIYCTDKKTGQPVELEQLYGKENRVWADYAEIPKYFKEAFIAIEDERFEEHNGVDWKRTIGAMVNWVVPIRQGFGGGSTITQQLIKNVTGQDDVTIKRKLQEIMRALELEKKYSKDEILELYLNTIFLGQNCNGVKTAAKVYFDKDLSQLSLAECASLAGITKNPSYYNPFRFPEHNKERQELILLKMLEQRKITQEEYDQAVAEKLAFKSAENQQQQDKVQSYFVDQVIEDVIKDLMDQKGYSRQMASLILYSGGLKIYTTIDVDVQAKMDQIFTDPENFPELTGKDGSMAQAAMTIMDPYTGNIVAMYGGYGAKTADRVLNRATQTTRSPGSSIKPLAVYAPALEYGLITPATVFDDAPKDFTVRSTGWPKNYYTGYRGRMTVQKAVEISNNAIPVEIINKLTPERSFNFMTANLGITSLVKAREYTTSSGATKVSTDIAAAPLALGGLTDGVSVLDMTAAYSSFVNRGIYTKPRTYTKVTDSSNTVILDNTPVTNVAMKEKTAAYILNLLQNVVNGSEGTGRKAKLENIATAGKTGTTTDDKDRWFVGLTPYYVASVWYGFDDPQEINISGNPALNIWKAVMDLVHKDLKPAEFTVNQEFVSTSICQDSGMLPNEYCSQDIRGNRVIKIMLAPEDVPKNVCTLHVPVQIDKVTGMIATEFCPPENLGVAAFLDIDRFFPIPGVTLGDSQYVLRPDADEGQTPKGYREAFPDVVNGKPAKNRACTVHTVAPVVPDGTAVDPNAPPGVDTNPPGDGDTSPPGGDTNPPGEDTNNPGGGDTNNPGGTDPNNPGGGNPLNPGFDEPYIPVGAD